MLAGGITCVLALAGLAAYAMLRPGYQVLFRDLKPHDASAIIAELEKEKVPYKVDETHAAILVPENDTRATRLKLMSSDLRLNGVVGLELFNNSDLGLTDFAQKVNYQRALQGELARTIMTLDEVEMARVHLTLPEASIFRRDQTQPKASVALFLHDGEALNPDIIRGIQRLVAASVPDMKPADVTVLDSRGSAAASHGIEDADSPQFALKRAIDRYYEQKVVSQIEALGLARRVSVSVDADINFDQTKITRESGLTRAPDTKEALLPAALAVTGTDMRSPLPPLPAESASSSRSSNPVQTHRTLEQIVSSPGAIRRLSVGVAFTELVPEETRTRLAALISASIGLDVKRGDVLSVLSMPPSVPPAEVPSQSTRSLDSSPVQPHAVAPVTKKPAPPGIPGWAWSICGAVLVGIALIFLFRRRGGAVRALTESERQALATRLALLLERLEEGHAKR
jgi:flagellar M-ring protein FliF